MEAVPTIISAEAVPAIIFAEAVVMWQVRMAKENGYCKVVGDWQEI